MKRNPTLKKLFNIQGGICAYCDREMDYNSVNRPESPTVDHIIPKYIAPEMKDHEHNLVCACKQCNNEKGAMPLALFLVQLKYRIPKVA